jgi:antitoxin (DNA-binding transcriptional repressor) of toxin-antitoxin stability system
MSYITVHAAKTSLSKLIARVLAGEEIIIARGHDPVAKLVALEKPNSVRKFGSLRGKVKVPTTFFDSLPAEELTGWGD